MAHSSSALALRHARQYLIEHGNAPAGAVSDRLARSWERSVAAGLQPVGRLPAVEPAARDALRQVLVRNHELLAYSRPVMEYLFEQVHPQQSVVVLADNRGTLMHTLGDPDFMNKSERVALAAGACWHEEQRGTNAIGTALAEQCAIEIHGAEHFLERNGFLTCAAAPIMSARGELLGILDVSGEQHSGHPHTLGLVKTAARMIENRLLAAACRQQRQLRLHLHAQAEGIGTLAEGMVVLNGDGWLVGANRIGMALLQVNAAQMGAVHLHSLIDTSLEQLLARHQRCPEQLTPVHLRDGSLLFVQLHAERQTSPQTAQKIDLHAAAAGASEMPSDALAALDSGDTQWRNAAAKVRRVLDKAIPVLIQGESGSGKEYLARAAHESSARRKAPFVAINCAAIPEHLIEAELFGYAPGAFTGASKNGSPGRLREAQGGTLFLDEIGDMPLAMQTRLLRVLQERSVTPLGTAVPVALDFALFCATHCNLRLAMEKGLFRSDLYYRINGLTVQLPALREREDFQRLVQRLLADLATGRHIRLATALQDQMQRYAWPGNLRQLTSVLRTAVAMLDHDDDCIDWQHLPDDIAQDLLSVSATVAQAQPQALHNLKELSQHAIQIALEQSQGNVSQAARVLGISRQTLYRRMPPDAYRKD